MMVFKHLFGKSQLLSHCLVVGISVIALFTNSLLAQNHSPYEEVEICENGLVANFYFDKTQKALKPPVIILGGSEGGLGHNKYLIHNLTQHGFSVMQVAYFKADGLGQTLTSVPLEFFDKAYHWLQKNEHTVKGKVAIIGTSKGGELALLLGSRNKYIATVVALVPSGYVFQGIAAKYHNRSSWSYKGKDLPFLPYQGGIKVLIKAIKKDYYGMYEDALKKKSQYPEAKIKVENIEAPILLISAENDQLWPSKAMCEEIVATLKEKESPYEYMHKCFETGHGVFKNNEARQLVIDFIRKHYKDKTEDKKTKDSHVIKSIKYYPMLDGYCAMTALRMNLNYYDVDVEQSLLLNLGWNYGFFLMSNPFYVGAYACTDPPQEIVYVSELLGFETISITHASLDEAKASLVKYISQDIPVLVQLTPHTILAYGYEDNGNTIIVHNPADPKPQLMPKTRWTQSKFNITEWLKEPLYWQYRQFQIVIVKPKTKKSEIEWKNIWKRAAQKTLGIEASDQPNYSGTKGLRSLADGIKSHFGQDEQRFRQILHNFNRTFKLGVAFRRNASSFLTGYAVATNNPNLSGAAKCFRSSAHLFRKGENLLEWSKKHPEGQPKVEKEIVEIIQHIIKTEESAAAFLFKATEEKR